MPCAGNVLPWKMDRILMKGNDILSTKKEPTITKIGHKRTGRLIFTLGIILNVYPKYYCCFYPYTKETVYKLQKELCGLGKTSKTTKYSLRDAETDHLFLEEVLIDVYVDPKTRRPKPHPEEHYKQAEEWLKTYKSPKFVKMDLPKDQKVYQHCMVTTDTDTDNNRHTNRNVYLRYAMDVGMKASYSGFYSHFKQDLMTYKIKKVVVLFRGETLPGTKLDVYTWEDKSDDKIVYFKIKRNEEHIIDCTVCYYTFPESRL